jgi:hypothetical protein
MKREEPSLYAPLRDEPIPTAETAMTWVDYAVVGSVLVPTLALIAWFVAANWPLLVDLFSE